MKVSTASIAIIATTLAHVVASAHAQVQSKCPARTAPCMNKTNFNLCKRIERSRCKDIRILESCPYQFTCADSTPVVPAPTPAIRAPTRPAAVPTLPAPAPTRRPPIRFVAPAPTRPRNPPTAPRDPCPPRSDECMTDSLYAQCQDLVKQGCTSVIGAMSCPYAGFGCLHELPPQTLPSPCPALDAPCMNEKNYAECQAVAKKGCKNIIALQSCPYAGFGCLDEAP